VFKSLVSSRRAAREARLAEKAKQTRERGWEAASAAQAVRLVAQTSRPIRGRVIALVLLSALCQLPYVVGWLLSRTVYRAYSTAGFAPAFLFAEGLIVASTIVGLVLAYVRSTFSGSVGLELERRTRRRLTDHLANVGYLRMTSLDTAQVADSSATGPLQLRWAVTVYGAPLLSSVFFVLAAAGTSIVISPAIGLCALAGAIIIGSTLGWLSLRSAPLSRANFAARGRLRTMYDAAYAPSGIAVDHVLEVSSTRTAAGRMGRELTAATKQLMTAFRNQDALRSTVTALVPVAVLLGCYASVPRVGFADTMVLITVFVGLIAPIAQIVQNIDMLIETCDGVAVAFGLLINLPSTSASPAPTARPADGTIRLRNIRVRYGGRHDLALDIPELDLPQGVVAIVAPTGSGKTTLLKYILGLLPSVADPRGNDPGESSGTIEVGGVEMTGWSSRHRGRWIVAVPQDMKFAPMTVAQNIDRLIDQQPIGEADRPDEDTMRQIRAKAAKLMAFDEVVASLEDGWETELRAGAPNLSGGEQTRGNLTALAVRQAILGAVVMVIDEALGPLNLEKALNILENIRALPGSTTLLVSHDMQVINAADYVVILDHGRIIQRGTPSELRQSGRYRDMLQQAAQRLGAQLT
jgi:ABC-type multidrug transport system fused ATPase/permease subunit